MDESRGPQVTLWHNPRCSKSRRAKELLEQAPCRLTLRHYLDDPPTAGELARLLALLGMPASALVRKGEPVFAELGLEGADEGRLLEAMSRHPILIQRPIAVTEDRASVGRPQGDEVLAVLQ